MKYDFIVVGGGPAGALLARRLADSEKAPTVLLVEAGGPNNEVESKRIADRWHTHVMYPEYNYNYMTAPQKNLANRPIYYPRGRGLGGSSAINFAYWTRGPKDDFEEWASQVGDDFFNWANTERRFKSIEGLGRVENPKHLEYVNPNAEDHGQDGPVKLSFAKEWELQQEKILSASYASGMKRNLDGNNGDPIGIFVIPSTAHKSWRTTSKSAYLDGAPSNLTIVTNSPATRILFNGKTAVGVIAGGKEYQAEKEIIVSAGSLDTPKLLMLSGVGPKQELDRHEIPIIANLPVGIGLQDHPLTGIVVQVKSGWDNRAEWTALDALELSRKQFDSDGTGSLTVLYNTGIAGFFKGDSTVYESKEFAALSQKKKEYINKPTIPTWELATLSPPLIPEYDITKSYLSFACVGMVPQSRGTVTLASKNPGDPPVIDPNFMDHPFDRKTMTDAIRQTYQLVQSPEIAKETVGPLFMPKSDSDEDIWEYIQESLGTCFHPSSSVIMGKSDDDHAVLTPDFKVKGLDGLRVADLSVVPFLPNCHTVSIAYLIGETAAERMISEYGLDR